MTRVLYYLVIIPISLLPFRVLFMISDWMYIILYRFIGYRKRVVRQNIERSFPDRSWEERRAIERRFFHHFMDLIIEAIKAQTLSRRSAMEHYRILNPEIFLPYIRDKKRVILTSGHYGNWELFVLGFPLQSDIRFVGVYGPLKDVFLEKQFRQRRGRYGMGLVSRHDVRELFHQPPEIAEAVILATDQSPSNARKSYWTTFLNQETAVFYGTEKFAREYDCPVIYMQHVKVKRSVYEVTLHVLVDKPTTWPYGAITEYHTRVLEADIIRKPEWWLWSHRRWKKTRPDDVLLHPAAPLDRQFMPLSKHDSPSSLAAHDL